MSTYLELCQKVASDSGTVTGTTQPLTVIGQTGRLARIVGWTAAAYTAIQNHRKSWLWMREEFEKPMTIGVQRYKNAELSLGRLGEFIVGQRMVSCYDPAVGLADEGFLKLLRYEDFYERYLVGAQRADTGKPRAYAIDLAGRLVVYPTPDKAYLLHGTYRKTPQLLVANDDLPEMPEQYHDLIVWKALLLLAEYDESMNQFPLWTVEYNRILAELEMTQMPQVTLGAALA